MDKSVPRCQQEHRRHHHPPQPKALVQRRGKGSDQSVEENIDRYDRRHRRPAPLEFVAQRHQHHTRHRPSPCRRQQREKRHARGDPRIVQLGRRGQSRRGCMVVRTFARNRTASNPRPQLLHFLNDRPRSSISDLLRRRRPPSAACAAISHLPPPASLLRSPVYVLSSPVRHGVVAWLDRQSKCAGKAPGFHRARKSSPIAGEPIAHGTCSSSPRRQDRRRRRSRARSRIPAGAEIHDVATGKVLMPGLVDSHSHIGCRQRRRRLGPDPARRPRVLDSLDVRDASIQKARAGGITTVNVMPGSLAISSAARRFT